MANLSDEDSQMHDSPSSTPSTPPLSQPQPHTHTHTHTHNLVNPAEHLSLHSPPDSQGHPQTSSQGAQAGQMGQGSSQAQMGMGGMGQVVPSWATKRAVEDAETAREKVVDGKFTLRWVGDDYDESDMFKTD
ncbi:hypothetical protein P167DRAFT_571868 [Morchella conica CCBAS932]|uniref:Uncharacterized protein n=1 Tax=Morchella conica CCBAS932 TaxID=1392247 RepID=A0A3N4L0I0_9PEZI|nr:hypothetical protein P167DRAFT_571868 [Morchella conica CCBAS932]